MLSLRSYSHRFSLHQQITPAPRWLGIFFIVAGVSFCGTSVHRRTGNGKIKKREGIRLHLCQPAATSLGVFAQKLEKKKEQGELDRRRKIVELKAVLAVNIATANPEARSSSPPLSVRSATWIGIKARDGMLPAPSSLCFATLASSLAWPPWRFPFFHFSSL